MTLTSKQIKYLIYAIREFDEIFDDWFLEIENSQIRYSRICNKYKDILGRAQMTGALDFDIASDIIGAHKRNNFVLIKKIVESLEGVKVL